MRVYWWVKKAWEKCVRMIHIGQLAKERIENISLEPNQGTKPVSLRSLIMLDFNMMLWGRL